MFYEKSYYLGSGEKAKDAYRLLHDALERTGRAAVGRFTFHNREYVAVIRPFDGVLALHTLRLADEVVDGDEFEFEAPRRGAGEREVKMAGQLVESLHEEFRPERYEDEYREAVLDVIKRKAAGKEIEPSAEEAEDDASGSHGRAAGEPRRGGR